MKRPRFSKMTSIFVALALAIPSVGLVTSGVYARPASPNPVVRYATRTDTTAALRHIPAVPPLPTKFFEKFQKPRKLLPNRGPSLEPGSADPVLQQNLGPSIPSIGVNFEGVNNVNDAIPPDTIGDIGPNHYVQMVNLSFAVYDRNGNLLYGPANNNTLWQGFGGPCETENWGDPIVLYDHLADRWLMSQFSLPNLTSGPFYECIAISQTSDPTGSWNRYEYLISQNKLNDYPKFGVWPDGYYMTVNQFRCVLFIFCNYAGQGAVVFERDQMLLGQPARMVMFDMESVDSTMAGMLPSDLDGTIPPPIGAPNPFMQIDDDDWGYSPDQLRIWNFHADWANPTSSTFTFDRTLNTAAFDSNMCNFDLNCVPQPGGSLVDALSDRLMFRLQYRNFGAHQVLVANHTVDVNGSDRAGIRWYELRDTGGGWGIFQEGTFSPDSHHRWMGSLAMNGLGDIALGYSIASSTLNPSIRFAGRTASDALGQLPQGEGTIINGGGYQTGSNRWGDYSMMAVDPLDDCTFWYTQEYYAVSSSTGWQTRIAALEISDCGGVDNPPTVSVTNPPEGSTVAGTVVVTADASDDNGVAQVEFYVDGGSIGVDTDGTDGWSASWDTTAYSDGSHTVSATATDTIGQTGNDSNGVTVDNQNDPPIATFTYACAGLSCDFDASGSSDPDGTVTNYDWDFGDSTTGSGVTTSHMYASAGTYFVELTIMDNDGATGSDTQNVSVSEIPATLHVGDMDGLSINSGKNWQAQVTITVHDASEELVSGAIVEGTWSGDASGSGNCTTDSSGACAITSSLIPKKGTNSAIFTVGSINHTSLSYQAEDNHDPDGDSSGSAIQINKDGSTVNPGNQPPVAAFTYSCNDTTLTCDFDASGSSDPDGTIVSYSWDFGDGNSGSGVMASHSYASAGNYTVLLTVVDNAGAPDTDSQQVVVGLAKMHVGDLDGVATLVRKNWNANVTITILSAGSPVANATVTGTWSGGASGTVSCITDGNGMCSVNSGNIPGSKTSATFIVDNVTHASYAYNPSANSDPDGDSDGTSITVPKPV